MDSLANAALATLLPSTGASYNTGALLCWALDRWRGGGDFYASTPSKKHRQSFAQLPFRLGSYSLLGQSPVTDVLVTWSSRSCSRRFLTHWRYSQSAFGLWCLRLLADRWLRKLLRQGSFSSLQSSALR